MQGVAENPKPPKVISISGNIKAPSEFYTKKKESIKALNSHVLYSYSQRQIQLVLNEEDHYSGTVTGKTDLNPDLVEFGINGAKMYKIDSLKKFLKMNRVHFTKQAENFEIVAALEKFNAKVETTIESETSNRGDKKNLLEVTVKSNMAMCFSLSMPVFVGSNKTTFPVEICFGVENNIVNVWLESPELQAMIAEQTVQLIDGCIEVFVTDGFAVIEQK
jgi:hypothetical protein